MRQRSLRKIIFSLWAGLLLTMVGCSSLPRIELEPTDLDASAKLGLVEQFEFSVPAKLRFRHQLNFEKLFSDGQILSNGVIVNKGEDVFIAGYIGAGTTLYTSKHSDGQFEILKDNLNGPEDFLADYYLEDLLLLAYWPGEYKLNGQIDVNNAYRNAKDNSLWYELYVSKDGQRYFRFIDNDGTAGVARVKDDKIYYKLELPSPAMPEGIKIYDYAKKRQAEIRFVGGEK